MELVTTRPYIKLGKDPLADERYDQLSEIRVVLSTGSAGHTTLRFHDAHEVGSTFSVGTPIEMGISSTFAKDLTVFTGEVASVGIEFARGRSELVVGAFDRSYRLGQQVVNQSHLNASPADVVKKIADAAGLTAQVDKAMSTKRPHIQQAATPHVFLTQLAEAYGCEWFVDGSTLVVERRASRGDAITLRGSKELRSFTARYSSIERTDTVKIRGWDPKTVKPLTGDSTSTGSTSLTSPEVVQSALKQSPIDPKQPSRDAIGWPRGAVSSNDAVAIADGVKARIEAAAVTGHGEVDADARLKPGVRVDIADVLPQWNGEYYLTEVEHVFGHRQPFVTRFRVGGLQPTSLVDLFGPTPPSSLERLTNGVTIGEVTNIADPDKLGRVKVRLPYLSDENESDWARVVQFGAGQKRGFSMSPEVGDEVLVAFEHGELQRPFIVGGLWNGNSPPVNADAVKDNKVVERALTNRTGDAIVLAEGSGDDEQYIKIELKDSTAVLFVGKSRIDLKAQKVPIEISTKDAKFLLDNGNITLKGNTITLDAKQDITLKGMNIKGEAKANAELGGKAGIKLKGAMAELSGDATTTIKGGMVHIN